MSLCSFLLHGSHAKHLVTIHTFITNKYNTQKYIQYHILFVN